MTTKIELPYPFKNIQEISEFANFKVGRKHKNSFIKKIHLNFVSKKLAYVIVIADNEEGIEFKKNFVCNTQISLTEYGTCLVEFDKINTDKQEWYGIQSLLTA